MKTSVCRYTRDMPLDSADLRIDVRWAIPMTLRDLVLEWHSVLIRDGRILDVLPSALAAQRYAATATLLRPTHVLMPGLVNANAAATAAGGGELPRSLAQMLRSGVTCFCDLAGTPEATARMAREQGMRAVIGLPVVAERTRALRLRDEYTAHPLVCTVFAPPDASLLDDAACAALTTLADELEAGVAMNVQSSAAEIARCQQRFGQRPIGRLATLGLLTPTFTAMHCGAVSEAEMDLLMRAGAAVVICLQATVGAHGGLPPPAVLAAARTRLGLGSGAARLGQDIWTEMRLMALLGNDPWDALHAATSGGLDALGLGTEAGALQSGRWADLCCVDLSGPARTDEDDLLDRLVYRGGREMVSDVWVAGRQLLSGGELTRLDWESQHDGN
jgi:5-methylthioadenosine/S-adenosylhomocysteine deaminase